MVLLDATYNVSVYDLPLFFMVVHTNVDCQVVAAFMLEDEKASSIQEALSIIKTSNPEWSPTVFLTDFCEAEIIAVEKEFPSKGFV